MKAIVFLLFVCLSLTSCSDSFVEDQDLYENASEGDDGKIKTKPGDI